VTVVVELFVLVVDVVVVVVVKVLVIDDMVAAVVLDAVLEAITVVAAVIVVATGSQESDPKFNVYPDEHIEQLVPLSQIVHRTMPKIRRTKK
jgi:hypothetical protein